MDPVALVKVYKVAFWVPTFPKADRVIPGWEDDPVQ